MPSTGRTVGAWNRLRGQRVTPPILTTEPVPEGARPVPRRPPAARRRALPPARRVRRRVPGAVVAFGMVSLLTDISSESVAAVLPLFATAVLGLSPLAYGFLDGVYQGVERPGPHRRRLCRRPVRTAPSSSRSRATASPR